MLLGFGKIGTGCAGYSMFYNEAAERQFSDEHDVRDLVAFDELYNIVLFAELLKNIAKQNVRR